MNFGDENGIAFYSFYFYLTAYMLQLWFVPLSIVCVRLLRGRLWESNSAPQTTPSYPDRSALQLLNGPTLKIA